MELICQIYFAAVLPPGKDLGIQEIGRWGAPEPVCTFFFGEDKYILLIPGFETRIVRHVV